MAYIVMAGTLPGIHRDYSYGIVMAGTLPGIHRDYSYGLYSYGRYLARYSQRPETVVMANRSLVETAKNRTEIVVTTSHDHVIRS